MANDSVSRLGRYIQARRQELGMSQIDVWKAGGPSNSTLTGLESGSASSISSTTFRKLDHALQWEPGTAVRILGGEEPKELSPRMRADHEEQVAGAAQARAWREEKGKEDRPPGLTGPGPDVGYEFRDDGTVSWSTVNYPIPHKHMWDLVLSMSHLHAEMRKHGDEIPSGELRDAIKKVENVGMDVIGAWFGGPDRLEELGTALQMIGAQVQKIEAEQKDLPGS